jgi:hypothetical protein
VVLRDGAHIHRHTLTLRRDGPEGLKLSDAGGKDVVVVEGGCPDVIVRVDGPYHKGITYRSASHRLTDAVAPYVVAVETVETVVGAHPDEAFLVLHKTVHGI